MMLKDLKAFIKRFTKDIESNITSKKTLDKMGKKLVKSIKSRVRKGKGAKEDFSKANGNFFAGKRFNKLSPEYKAQRRKLKKQGKLSKDTTPAKSNQTSTGKLVGGIHYKVVGDSIDINTSPDREEIASFQEEMGNIAVGLTKDESEIIDKTIDDAIDKSIDKFF